MAKYILTKFQIKRLINGQYVIDGHGRKFFAGKEINELLRMIDENNLYNRFDVTIEDGKIDFVKKCN